MDNKRFANLIQRIFHTQDEEISCSECFDLVSGYVEMEMSGKDASQSLPQVNQHLGQCPACREEYETLRDLRRMEEDHNPPSVDDLRGSIH